MLNFSLTRDGNIWLRNYQIVDDTGRLEEIGPRMVLEVVRLFAGSFHGEVLYDNPHYVAPNARRRELKLAKAAEHRQRQGQKEQQRVKEERIRETRMEEPLDLTLFDPKALDGEGAGVLEARRLERAILKGGGAKKRRARKGRRGAAMDGADDGVEGVEMEE